MTLVELTFLISELNALLDRGEKASISETREHIRNGDTFAWLRKTYPGLIDVSIYEGQSPEREISKQWQDILGGYEGRERKKWGVENNGLCLLLAWTNELVQQRVWKDDRS